MIKQASIVVLLLFFSAVVKGQKSDSISLRAAEVSDSLFKQRSDISQGMFILSGEAFQLQPAFDIFTSLNRVPGIFAHHGTFSTSRITMRGIGSREPFGTSKIKAYFNDIPLTDGSGISTLEDIDPLFISGARVHKGPNSSVFGAGLGGTIQLLSPKADTASMAQTEAALMLASYNTRHIQAKQNFHSKRFSTTVGYAHLNSNGYRENASYTKHQFFFDQRLRTSPGREFGLMALYTDVLSFIPSSLNITDYQQNPSAANSKWLASKGHEDYNRLLVAASFNSIKKFGQKFKTTLFFNAHSNFEPRPFNILSESTSGIGFRTNYQRKLHKWRFSVGAESLIDEKNWSTYENLYNLLSNGSVKGEKLNNYIENRFYLNAFADLKRPLFSNLLFHFGLNVNSTSYTLSNLESDSTAYFRFSPLLSPKIGIIWYLKEDARIFAQVSQGFSNPSLEETLNSSDGFNEMISQEIGWNYELGLEKTSNSLELQLSGFLMDISDLIVRTPILEDQFTLQNVGSTLHLGMEFFGQYAISIQSLRINLSLAASVSRFSFVDFSPNGVDVSGNSLPGIPLFNCQPVLQFRFKKNISWTVNASAYGKQFITDDNLITMPSYAILRTKLEYTLKWKKARFGINAGINNILNQHYASMLLVNAGSFGGALPRYYYPGMPRNFFGGLQCTFN